jgi:ribosomal protein RSM22 (predicted rRNA methylase)
MRRLSRGMTSEMIPASLPTELQAALSDRLEGLSRHDAAQRAARISQTYREGGTSGGIRSEIDAMAYALARMPATYAAVAAALNALCELRPDFAPHTLLDIGAGPGTASWAAVEAFASLTSFALADDNESLRTLALDLMRGSVRLGGADYRKGEARDLIAAAEPADLVIASYVIGELDERERTELAALAWHKTRDTLLIVEPGTPGGYARIVALRAQLIDAGAHVAAPCPHDRNCPLTSPDWCHFTQRLPRSRAHKEIKGVDLPFEDEKFAYVALMRNPPVQRAARVLAQPVLSKVEVAAKLCAPEGLVATKVPRRDKANYARARRWRWGDAVIDDKTAGYKPAG